MTADQLDVGSSRDRAAELQIRQIVQCPYTRKEEVRPTLYRRESAETVYSCSKRLALDRENAIAPRQVADQRVDFAFQASEYGIVDPGLLDKFKLAFDVAIQTNEMQASLDGIVHQRVFNVVAVRASATQDAMAVGGVQSRRRIGT